MRLPSADALTIAHAYMNGTVDFEGNLLEMLRYQELLRDAHPGIYLWRRLHRSWSGGRASTRRGSPCITMRRTRSCTCRTLIGIPTRRASTRTTAKSSNRPLSASWQKRSRPCVCNRASTCSRSACGWGGMLRFSAQRGVRVTGITLSQRQKDYVEQKIAEEKLPAEVRYQDFFTFQPGGTVRRRFDDGVIEDLSDYRLVMRTLAHWVKPGGRVYLDFAARGASVSTPTASSPSISGRGPSAWCSCPSSSRRCASRRLR